MIRVLAPSFAAEMAAIRPAFPAPHISTSVSIVSAIADRGISGSGILHGLPFTRGLVVSFMVFTLFVSDGTYVLFPDIDTSSQTLFTFSLSRPESF
jgi:hypothetical protein